MSVDRQDSWSLYGKSFTSRLLIGSALYPSPQVMCEAILASGAEIITVGLRRQSPEQGGGEAFWQQIKSLGKTLWETHWKALPESMFIAKIVRAFSLIFF